MKNGAKAFIRSQKTGKYLLVLRDDNPQIPFANMWGLLGGGIEGDEDPASALIREINEEIGIKIFNLQHICSRTRLISLNNNKYKVTGDFFLAETEADLMDMILTEGQKIDFFTVIEILNLPNTTPAVKELIHEFPHFFK